MAAGEFTESFYELLDDLGGDQSTHALNALLDGLVRWMQGHKLEEFVEDYRRTCEVKTSKELEEEDQKFITTEQYEHIRDWVQRGLDSEKKHDPKPEPEMETNDFEMCMVCQDTYHEDEKHICKE